MAWFRISFAEKAFLRLLTTRGIALESLSVDEGAAAMIAFYTEHRAQHTRLDEHGDGLLFRWSPGQLDVTRQLLRSGGTENPVMRLTLVFEVDAVLPAAGERAFWDPAMPIEVPSFFRGRATRVFLDYAAA